MDHILFVEDNKGIVDGVLPTFQVNQFEIVHAATVKEAKRSLLSEKFVAVILDINLPDGSGLDLCKEIHEAFPTLPILMLTAQDEDKKVVESLSLGAIDYIRKPFSNQELIARVRRFTSREVTTSGELRFGKLTLETKLKSAIYEGKEITLTKREMDLLTLLVKRAGSPATRAEILQLLEDDGEIFDRTIDSHITNLRRKLKNASSNRLNIKALYGMGYKLEGK